MSQGKQRRGAAAEESWVSRHFVLVILGVFGLVGVIMLVAAGLTAANARAVLDRERSARGRVVAVERRTDPEDGPYFMVSIEYPLPSDEIQRIAFSTSERVPGYAVGDSVDLRYDPLFPVAARLDTPGSAATEWVLPIILGFMGAAFTAGPVVALLVIRPRSWRDL